MFIRSSKYPMYFPIQDSLDQCPMPINADLEELINNDPH